MAVDPAPVTLTGWALVLGASSGFGAAASLALARAGCNIFGVHFDRKSTQPGPARARRHRGHRARAHFSTSTPLTKSGAGRSWARWSAS